MPKSKPKARPAAAQVSDSVAVTSSPESDADFPVQPGISALPAVGDRSETAAPILVWLLLGLLLVLHLKFAVEHSFPVPYWDESGFIPYVVGAKPVTASWLWSQENEHRIPLPKLIYLGLARISGYDSRLMNTATVLLLAATACFLLRRLRRLEGRTTYAHAFVPLLLLNPAHYPNTVWPIQLGFVLPTCFICYTIAVLAERGGSSKSYLLLGPITLLNCMCGANGLPLALAISPMLFWIGMRDVRAGARRRGWASILFGAAVYGFIGIYFIHLNRVTPPMRPWKLDEAVVESLKAISMALGPSADLLWPYAAIAIVALGIACTLLLLSVIWKQPANRLAASGLLLALAGSVALAVGIGFGRTTLGLGAGFATRYATFVAPILVAIFFAYTRFGSIAVQRFVQMALLLSLALVFSLNGLRPTSEINEQVADGRALEDKVARHVPITQLAAEHGSRWMFRPDIFAENMRLLRNARTGIYRRYPPAGTADMLLALAEGTELKGPGTSGQLFRLDQFGLPTGTALMAHAPHRASVILDRPARSVHVGFGLLFQQSAGVEFRVSLRTPEGGSNVIWSHALDPVHVPGDAGIKEADIALPPSADRGSAIVFETATRPAATNLGCWSFWTAVAVH